MADLDTEALLAEYDASRGPHRTCLVCDSEYAPVINEMLRRGGGAPSVSRFLDRRLHVQISVAVLGRHKSTHLHDDTPA